VWPPPWSWGRAAAPLGRGSEDGAGALDLRINDSNLIEVSPSRDQPRIVDR
jgi:hypothetical protein